MVLVVLLQRGRIDRARQLFVLDVLDLHELAAGKLSALFSRPQARDLFDCHRVLDTDELQRERLADRLGRRCGQALNVRRYKGLS